MLLLVDGDYLLHRSLHVKAFQALQTTSGRRVGPVFGILKALHAITAQNTLVTSVYVLFGKGKSPRRVELFPDYKVKPAPKTEEERAEKQEQYSIFQDNLDLARYIIPHLGCRGYQFEGESDDALCYVAKHTSQATLILSDDKDMLTLVSDKTSVYRPAQDSLITLRQFQAFTGLKTPKHFLLYKALMGDPSDRIPGIMGIGPKKAALICESLDLKLDDDPLRELKLKMKNARIYEHDRVAQGFNIVERNLQLMDMTRERISGEEAEGLMGLLKQPVHLHYAKISQFLKACEFKSIERDIGRWLIPFQNLT